MFTQVCLFCISFRMRIYWYVSSYWPKSVSVFPTCIMWLFEAHPPRPVWVACSPRSSGRRSVACSPRSSGRRSVCRRRSRGSGSQCSSLQFPTTVEGIVQRYCLLRCSPSMRLDSSMIVPSGFQLLFPYYGSYFRPLFQQPGGSDYAYKYS